MGERLRCILIDIVTINVAWVVYYKVRVSSGLFDHAVIQDFFIPMVSICVFWLLLFFTFGLYRSWYRRSRLDEFTTIFKATSFGVLFLFFLIFIDDRGMGSPLQSRLLIVFYWVLMVVFVGGGRFIMHTFHRHLLIAGYGTHNTLIIGWSDKARELYDMVNSYPALGYKVVGFVQVSRSVNNELYKGIPILETVESLPDLIDKYAVRDVLIALDSSEHDQLLNVISQCDSKDVSIKIIPDLYDIISGQARTNQIYGFPLIEIMPEIMQPWEKFVKRAIDIIVSFLILVLGMPIWLIVALAIKLDSKGPIFYTQERVGKDGRYFHIIKFRSMYVDAEHETGPIWANKKDPRVTRVGRIIRKMRIDELPQLVNVLAGHMSLVGPRPERPFFVEQLSKEIPFYKRRLKVRPGVTGWAQVKHKYDESIEDVKKKVEYDLFYIENMSLRMDLKILLNTIAVILAGKGH